MRHTISMLQHAQASVLWETEALANYVRCLLFWAPWNSLRCTKIDLSTWKYHWLGSQQSWKDADLATGVTGGWIGDLFQVVFVVISQGERQIMDGLSLESGRVHHVEVWLLFRYQG